MGGRSGRSFVRVALVTARPRTLPPLICSLHETTEPNMTWICPQEDREWQDRRRISSAAFRRVGSHGRGPYVGCGAFDDRGEQDGDAPCSGTSDDCKDYSNA